MKKKSIGMILAAILSAGMILAGCGGSGTSDAASSAASAASSAASEAAGAASSAAPEATEAASSATSEAAEAASSAASEATEAAEGAAAEAAAAFSDLQVPDGTGLKIGYLAQNETDAFCVIMGNALEEEGKKYGVEVLKSDAQSIAANQVTQAEDFVTRGVDAVIISAVDQDASAPAVQKVVDAGIPIIILNTLVSNADIGTAYVGVDDRDAGEVALSIIAEQIGDKGTINIIQGLLGHPANENRMTGIEEALANYPDIKIGATQAADWDRNKAMNIASDWLSSGSQIDAIVALNDEMAISAANTFSSAGQNIPIVGIDALDEALQAIIDGKMSGTVFQDGPTQGKVAMDVAIMAAKGESVDKEYLIPFEPVTADNAADYMGRVG